MPDEISASRLFNSLQLLQAYEKAIDANIISSITDTNGIIVHANKRFCEISKYAVEEVLGQSHSIINSGYHPEAFFNEMWQTIKKGEVWHHEIKNKAKDASYYWVDTVIVPVKDDSGNNTHYLSLRTLITERKQLEKKKAQYVASLETLLVMTSNNVKRPLSDCLKQINIFDPAKPSSKNELKRIVENLKLSTFELDSFTQELTTFIREIRN